MKRTALAVLLALLLFFNISILGEAAEQSPITLEQALQGANDELKNFYSINFNYFRAANLKGNPLSINRWKEKDRILFVYGEPYGDTKETEEGTRYRYLGETVTGHEFVNPHFPHDEWSAGLKIENFALYKRPWNEEELKDFRILGKEFKIEVNLFNENLKYLPHIQRGLKMFYYNDDPLQNAIIGESHRLWDKWHEYVYIIQPPTKWAWGLGCAFHKDSRGIIWYIPIPLPASIDLEPPSYDVKIELKSDKYTLTRLSSGERESSNVSIIITRKDDIPGDLPITVTLYLGGDPIVMPMSLGPGGNHEMSFPFGGWNTATLSGEVWPDGKDDAYPPDNKDSITIAVNEVSVPRGDSKIITILIDD